MWEYIHNDDNKVYDTLVLTKSGGSGSVSSNEGDKKDEIEDKGYKEADNNFQSPNAPINEL